MPELTRIGRALRRWWWAIVAAAVAGALAGAVSAEATGGPAYVTTATFRLEVGATLPLAHLSRPIELLPLQSAIDETMAGPVQGVDASAAIARAADTDSRRTVHITVAAASADRARTALDTYLERFRAALKSVQSRWRTSATTVLDAARAAPGADDGAVAAMRAVVDEVGTADPIAAVDVSPPSAPTATAAIALLSALALAALTAAAVALVAPNPLPDPPDRKEPLSL